MRPAGSPAVIYVFGGGFRIGDRHKPNFVPWYGRLRDAGYAVFAIDYRLGMAGRSAAEPWR